MTQPPRAWLRRSGMRRWQSKITAVAAVVTMSTGAGGSVLNVLNVAQLNHRPVVESGLLAEECADLLRAFFGSRRR